MKKIKVLMLVPNLFVANGVASFVMNYLRNLIMMRCRWILHLTKRATLFIMLR